MPGPARAYTAFRTARPVDFAAPALAAAYPVVYLFAQNIVDQVTADTLWLPLAVIVVAAVLATTLVGAAASDMARAGLSVAFLALLVLTYGHLWTAGRELVPSQTAFLALWLAVAAAGLWGVWRLGRRARRVSTAVAIAAAGLLLVNGWTIARHATASSITGTDTGELRADPESTPDVYYLMFDRYAGATALAETYGVDNEPFLRALEERGFYVARNSHSNYARSPLSLVSSLSMDYLDHEALKAEADAGGHPINAMLRGSLPVPRALKDLGYTYVHVGGLWEPSSTNADADLTLRRSTESEFTAALRESTILGALTDTSEAVVGDDASEDAPQEEWTADALRAHTLYQLDRVAKTATLPGPKYVFAHIALPHPPYVFDSDGSRPSAEELETRGEAENYARQLAFTSAQILVIVDRIISESPNAVILVQSDEGPWPERLREGGDDFPWSEFTAAELEEKYGILNAYRLPGVEPEEAGLYPTITPVNSLRVVLNAYFGTDLELLPDRMYAYPDNHHFYDLFEITERFASR